MPSAVAGEIVPLIVMLVSKNTLFQLSRDEEWEQWFPRLVVSVLILTRPATGSLSARSLVHNQETNSNDFYALQMKRISKCIARDTKVEKPSSVPATSAFFPQSCN